MLKVRTISSSLQTIAEKDLNEVPKRISEDIKHIRNWLIQQPHIRARTDDQWILNFLRSTKFSLERTKEKLDQFYTMRSLMPAYFTKRDPFLPEVQEILKQGILLPLPKTIGEGGARIILVQCRKLNTKTTPFPVLMKTLFMLADIVLYEDDNAIVGGQHAFGDLQGASLEYVLSINPNDTRQIVVCLEKGYPSRPQAIDLLNTPSVYATLINVVRSFLSDKIRNRLHVYDTGSSADIYKIIPRSHLPKEYGGECGTVAELTAYWKNKVESYRDWLIEDELYRVDETKRPGKPKTAQEMFGIEGSFRKLDLD